MRHHRQIQTFTKGLQNDMKCRQSIFIRLYVCMLLQRDPVCPNIHLVCTQQLRTTLLLHHVSLILPHILPKYNRLLQYHLQAKPSALVICLFSSSSYTPFTFSFLSFKCKRCCSELCFVFIIQFAYGIPRHSAVFFAINSD